VTVESLAKIDDFLPRQSKDQFLRVEFVVAKPHSRDALKFTSYGLPVIDVSLIYKLTEKVNQTDTR
jgi:hypothetical protein